VKKKRLRVARSQPRPVRDPGTQATVGAGMPAGPRRTSGFRHPLVGPRRVKLGAMRVRFDRFILDTETRELLRSEAPVSLSPKAFELLELLVAHRPKAMAKHDLLHVADLLGVLSHIHACAHARRPVLRNHPMNHRRPAFSRP